MRDPLRLLAVAAAAVVSFGVFGPMTSATAAAPQTAPCAKQQHHVDKGEAAQARVTAVFDMHTAKVDKDKNPKVPK